jgi:hypothetical protein
MNTRIGFLLFCFLFSALALHAQSSNNPAIKSKFDSYIDYSNHKEWDKAFDYIYPKLFAKVPKQELVNMMQTLETDGMTLNMENTQITSYSEPMKDGKETFVKLTYTSDLIVGITKGGAYDAPKAIQAIDEQFRATYGGRSVQWDATAKIFRIHATKSMMAINPGDGDWKLVEINLDQPDLMAYLFSQAVMDKLVLAD